MADTTAMRRTTITITNPDLIRRILREQAVRGNGTAAATAGQLIRERLMQIEADRVALTTSVRTDELRNNA